MLVLVMRARKRYADFRHPKAVKIEKTVVAVVVVVA
jgi:hypothetical protein